ncbi:unnamed protein product [Cuscuta epithymum]|uniref:Uncharacterized protein n=1 Tax=Cuscuta epithymum TaxID=186058 RepID=A0AAV0D5T8_9ASTE|nr:unnamed protein product [Cuscuta epithymum]
MRVNSYCNLHKVMEMVRNVLSREELEDFKTTVFGWLADFDSMEWVRGQLQLGLVGNYVQYVNGLVDKNVMRFHIQKSVISFTKKDLAIVTGLKLSGVKPVLSEEPT